MLLNLLCNVVANYGIVESTTAKFTKLVFLVGSLIAEQPLSYVIFMVDGLSTPTVGTLRVLELSFPKEEPILISPGVLDVPTSSTPEKKTRAKLELEALFGS